MNARNIVLTTLLCIVTIFSILGCGDTSSNEKTNKKISYTNVDINVLMNDLEINAASASKKYKGKYVRITNGRITNIDSDGDYFTLEPLTENLTLASVHCSIESKKIKKQLLSLRNGERIIVYGHITDVGDIIGYSLDTQKIETP
ncbi:OB-fold protein [Selenomonas ruminis]|nr:hypothetical protein [Selenomonas sp. mPRGC5]